MRCTPKTSLNKSITQKQIIAVAFLVSFIVASLLTEVFILTSAKHAHDQNGVGGTCAACIQLQNAENLLKQLETAATRVFFSLTGLFAISIFIMDICSNIAILTLITLKIRMNN